MGYLILSAVQKNISGAMFWRLLLGTVVMLASGYMGEAGFVNAWIGFIVGMAGWAFILGQEEHAGQSRTLARLIKVRSPSDPIVQSSSCMSFVASLTADSSGLFAPQIPAGPHGREGGRA